MPCQRTGKACLAKPCRAEAACVGMAKPEGLTPSGGNTANKHGATNASAVP
jgi:hypothetical protein